MRKHRGIVWCVGLCALLMLAGCGGNGGGGTGDMQTTNEMLNAARAAAMKAYSDAQAALAAVEADKDADMDSYDMAKAQVDAAKAANDKAQAATTVADAEKYRDEAQAAYRDAMQYAGMVSAAADNATNAAAMARVKKLTAAIADPDRDGQFPEPNELTTTRRPGVEPTYMAGRGAIMIGTDTLGKNDPSINNAREFAEDTTAKRASISGFNGSVYKRTMDGKTDTVTFYSDAKANEDQAFNAFYPATTSGTAPLASVAAATTAPAGKTTYNTLTFATTSNLLAGDRTVTGSGFPTVPTQAGSTETRTQVTGAGDSFTGTFHGVPGRFSCATGADCVIEATLAGGIQVATGTMTFTPTETTDDTQEVHVIEGAVPDSDYLSFGYWVQTQGTGDDMKYGINTFAGGSQPFGAALSETTANAAILALNGTATYEGSATGYYARKDLMVVDGAVKGEPVAAGQFVANADLTAYFGNAGFDDIANNQRFTIMGTVDNFQDADGETINDNWTLKLNSTMFRNTAVSEAYNAFSGTTGENNLLGQWRGGFYGPSTPANTMPSGVAGEFTGHFNDGHVIGAFGALKQE